MILQNLEVLFLENTIKIQCFIDNQIIYIEFSNDYKDKYVLNYDGFLLLVLPVAMKKKEDIFIKGSISYKLHHNIKNYLMKIINYIYPECHIIDINAEEYSSEKIYNNKAFGCGLSCGIDSLCCLQDYYFDYNGPYKLTHVTNFQAGASKNTKQFEKRLENVINYIKNLSEKNSSQSLQLLKVLSNFDQINNIEHQKIHTLRNLSIPLFFQKLFKIYFYSSAYHYKDCIIKKDNTDIAYSDPIIIPLLSTENIEFMSHGSQYTRIEKTIKISNNTFNFNYLDICVNGKYKESNNNLILNCSICWKCMRTLVVLDYFQKLNLFKNVFHIDKYLLNKDKYIQSLNLNDTLQKEFIDIIKYNKNEKIIKKPKFKIKNKKKNKFRKNKK